MSADHDAPREVRVAYARPGTPAQEPPRPRPSSGAEAAARYRARQRGEQVPRRKPGPKPTEQTDLRLQNRKLRSRIAQLELHLRIAQQRLDRRPTDPQTVLPSRETTPQPARPAGAVPSTVVPVENPADSADTSPAPRRITNRHRGREKFVTTDVVVSATYHCDAMAARIEAVPLDPSITPEEAGELLAGLLRHRGLYPQIRRLLTERKEQHP